MCNLVIIQNNLGQDILVAEVKASILKRIIEIAPVCSKIEYLYLFGSSLETRCNSSSDIDLALVSNVVRSRLCALQEYHKFKDLLYDIDLNQEYDLLQFNSLSALWTSKDTVCRDIQEKGVLLYQRIR